MKLKEVVEIVQGTILTRGSDMDMEVKYCGAMDLMSDALAYLPPGSMLLTGLKNIQAIRTAEMAYVTAVLFVRGKVPTRKPSSWPKNWAFLWSGRISECSNLADAFIKQAWPLFL